MISTFLRAAFLAVAVGLLPQADDQATEPRQLSPTAHAALPADASELWLVPTGTSREARTIKTYAPLAEGVARLSAEDYTSALQRLTTPSLAGTPLAPYALYYSGLAQLRLGRVDDARRTLESLRERKPDGAIGIAATLAAGEAATAAGKHDEAAALYEAVAGDKAALNDDVLDRLARAALAAGDRKKAAEAFVRLYYEFPLTDAAAGAAAELEQLQDQITRRGNKADLGRAQVLFGARRWAEAQTTFRALQSVVDGDDKELVDLRVAECDFQLRRWAAVRDGVRPYLEDASRKAEARFFHLSALRELGLHDQYVQETHALVRDFPDSSWSEDALNNLGTHYILTNEDQLAAETFREMYERYPAGPRAERAAWKYGWWEYKNGNYGETIRVFESAASTFQRSDYRPSFLYWAGRSHAKLGAVVQANARLRLVHTDYGNSYYGRLAEKRLTAARAGLSSPDDLAVPAARSREPLQARAAPEIRTEPIIRLLLANGLYDDALNELRYAQRAWGSSTAIDATIAYAHYRKGELRRAITLMRRAYPQHLTASSELPTEILQVIFPLTYWESIRRHSVRHDLDPYLVAALIAQESTFDPEIRSAANAWGLMQIVPATGRRLARAVGIRRFSTPMLTNAETNIRLGTLHFANLVRQFGGTYYALASYNAGENRVVRWKAERPGINEDEFIDDIPFPETQNYVKRILGTAEDYRALYSEGKGKPLPAAGGATTPPSAAVKVPAKKPATKPAVRKAPPKKAPATKPVVRRSTRK